MFNYKNQFTRRLTLFLTICCLTVLFACDPDPLSEDSDKTSGVVSQDFEELQIGSADNIFIGSAGSSSPSQSMFFVQSTAVSDSGVMTIDSTGDIQTINAKGGQGKLIKKFLKIRKKDKQNSKLKAVFKSWDSAAQQYECHLVDQSDKVHKLRGCPIKSHRLKNAPEFYEDGPLYFIDQSLDLIGIDISQDISGDVYNVVKNDVEQAVRGKNGDWMIAYVSGQVRHVTGDTETRMNANIPSWYVDAEVNRFFMTNKEGFFFRSDGHWCNNTVFYRASWSQSQLSVTSAHVNNNVQVCFYPYSNPDICSLNEVGNQELLICGEYVYRLGDAANDVEAIDFVWAGHVSALSINHIKTVVSNNFVYHYTQGSETIARFSRIDLSNQACQRIFDEGSRVPICVSPFLNNMYSIDQLTAASDDTVRFCGNRIGSTQKYLVEIKNAGGASPTIRETTVDICEQLANL